MPDYGARIIIEGDARKVVAEFDKLKRSIGGVAGQSGVAKKSSIDLSAALRSGAIAIAAVTGALYTAKKVFDSTVGAVIAYNKSILDASRATGTTAEDFSRIVQVADDFGISMGSVERALALATKNGFAPSVDSLADLADELNAMSTPTERAAAAAKIFGRQWATLDPLLQEGGKRIRELAAAVSDGLVATDAEIKKTEEARLALDKLGDTWTSLKNTIALEAVPLITKGLTNMNDVLSGNITFLEGVRRGLLGMREAQLDILRDLGLLPKKFDAASGAQDGWKAGMLRAIPAAGELAEELESLSADAALTALVTASLAGESMAATDALWAQYNAARALAEQQKKLADALRSATNRSYNYIINYVVNGQAPTWGGKTLTAPSNQSGQSGLGPRVEGAGGKFYRMNYDTGRYVPAKHGFEGTIPPGFPNDSFRFGATSGEEVSISPRGETNNNNQRNVTFNGGVTIANGMDLAEFESMLRQSLRGVR